MCKLVENLIQFLGGNFTIMAVSVSEGTDFGQKKKLNQKFIGLWFKP